MNSFIFPFPLRQYFKKRYADESVKKELTTRWSEMRVSF